MDFIIGLGLSGVAFALVLIVTLGIYLLPTMIAFGRKHERRWLIFAVDLLAAWTGVLWIVALIWACLSPKHESEIVNQAKSLGNMGEK